MHKVIYNSIRSAFAQCDGSGIDCLTLRSSETFMMPNTYWNGLDRSFYRSILFLGVAIFCCPRAASQNDLEATDRRIFQEVREHNHLMENLEYRRVPRESC